MGLFFISFIYKSDNIFYMKSRFIHLAISILLLSGCSCAEIRDASTSNTSSKSSGSKTTTHITSDISTSDSDISSGTSTSVVPPVIPDFEYELVEYEEVQYAKITKIMLIKMET